MFELFGLPHIGALGAIAAVALAAALAPRPVSAARLRRVSLVLALALLANEAVWHGYQFCNGTWQVESSLPLHLCDAAVFVSVVALLTQRQVPYELAYFWGLGGSSQALVTPGITASFPSYEFFRYFCSHGGIIVVVAYLTFGRRMRPRPGSVARTIAISAVYMVVVGVVNKWLSANYMFICRKPETASVIDVLGNWPWYLLPLAATAVGSMLLLYLPYYILDLRRRRAAFQS